MGPISPFLTLGKFFFLRHWALGIHCKHEIASSFVDFPTNGVSHLYLVFNFQVVLKEGKSKESDKMTTNDLKVQI